MLKHCFGASVYGCFIQKFAKFIISFRLLEFNNCKNVHACEIITDKFISQDYKVRAH